LATTPRGRLPAAEPEHYLQRFKQELDRVFGAAPLHVCIEAAHPRSLGRPSLLVRRILGNFVFPDAGDRTNGPESIHIHYYSDRLSLRPMTGHVLAIGGPRSNVVSRVAMEYEVDAYPDVPFYKRHAKARYPIEYTHIHREDYDGVLPAEMTSLDNVARGIVHYYYQDLQPREVDGAWRSDADLFSVNRYIHRRRLKLHEKSPAPVFERAGHRVDIDNLPSLSARIKDLGEEGADYVVYDHFVETIMPNVFSRDTAKNSRHAMVILHGLRSLGTFAALSFLSHDSYYTGLGFGDESKRAKDSVALGFRQRLEKVAAADKGRPICSLYQTGWSVCRPLNPMLPPAKGKKARKTSVDGFFVAINEVRDSEDGPRFKRMKMLDEEFAISPHKYQGIPPFPSDAEIISKFREEVQGTLGATMRSQRAIKIDRIDENQILDAMSLPRDPYFRRHDIYALGSFERKKTVLTQQTRALTLVHALYKAGKIKRDTKIVIVGGGVSGMSAAIAAAEVGARVVLVEAGSRLARVQRNCEHRYLHPYFYDWPGRRCGDVNSNFPIEAMNWAAGSTREVMERLEKQFVEYRDERNSAGDSTKFTVYTRWPVHMIMRDRTNGKHIVARRKLVVSDRKEFLKLSGVDGLDAWSQMPYSDPDAAIYPPSRWRSAASALVRDLQNRAIIGGEPCIHLEDDEGSTTGFPIDPATGMAEGLHLGKKDVVDGDIVIFATGFGRENSLKIRSDLKFPKELLLNSSYWTDDRVSFKPSASDVESIYIVSGSGDGALIDILRICIEHATEAGWQSKFVENLTRLVQPNHGGAVWLTNRDVLVFAEAFRKLCESDDFRQLEGEKDRLQQIDQTMKGFDIDAFLDLFNIELNPVTVINVDPAPQPFWPDSSVAHRLLVWCLYKKGRVRFIRGRICGYDTRRKEVLVKRAFTGKTRGFKATGVVLRHGVGSQAQEFLKVQGLLIDLDSVATPESRFDDEDKVKTPFFDNMRRAAESVASDGRRLVSLLRLSNDLHPETEKFFRHTVKHLR
jgi:hypothetical protein